MKFDREELRRMATFLQENLHNHCSGYMFSEEDVFDYMIDFILKDK